MKFKIHVKNDKSDWWEEYDEKTGNPQMWAEATVDEFNETLRVRELPRTLIEVEILD